MKLIIFVFCIFTVCFGATSRLKATQVIVNEEQLIEEIPGGSYELNTVGAEEEPLAAAAEEPAAVEAAGPIEIEPVYVEAQAEEPAVVEAAEPAVEIEPVYVEAQAEEPAPESNAEPVYATVSNNEELTIVEEPTVYNTVEEIPQDNEVYYTTAVEPEIIEEPVVEEIPDTEVYYTTTAEPIIIEEPAPVVYEAEEVISGGYSDVPLSSFEGSDELKSAAQVCIDALLGAAQKDGKIASGAGWQLSAVNRIRTQVVAGTNYNFEVVLGNEEDADARIYATFTAFSQPWTSTLACTDGCVKIGRMVRV